MKRIFQKTFFHFREEPTHQIVGTKSILKLWTYQWANDCKKLFSSFKEVTRNWTNFSVIGNSWRPVMPKNYWSYMKKCSTLIMNSLDLFIKAVSRLKYRSFPCWIFSLKPKNNRFSSPWQPNKSLPNRLDETRFYLKFSEFSRFSSSQELPKNKEKILSHFLIRNGSTSECFLISSSIGTAPTFATTIFSKNWYWGTLKMKDQCNLKNLKNWRNRESFRISSQQKMRLSRGFWAFPARLRPQIIRSARTHYTAGTCDSWGKLENKWDFLFLRCVYF